MAQHLKPSCATYSRRNTYVNIQDILNILGLAILVQTMRKCSSVAIDENVRYRINCFFFFHRNG